MKTPFQELIQGLEADANFLDGKNDKREDRIVGQYLRSIVGDLKNSWLEKEKQMIIDTFNKGHEDWLHEQNGEHFDTGENYYNQTFNK